MEKLELKALGKINLGLDVLGRRENGYHDVRMIMQTLYLYDNVTLQKKAEPGIEIESNLFYLPKDENNIAWKAAQMLMEEFDLPGGIGFLWRNVFRWRPVWQAAVRMQQQSYMG